MMTANFTPSSTPFEISAGNLTGLTIKVHRGQTVSGSVVIEGPTSAEAQASLSQLPLVMSVLRQRRNGIPISTVEVCY